VVFLLPLDKFLVTSDGGDARPAADGKCTGPWFTLGVAILLGTVFGIWLQQTSFKLSLNVGVASTLLSTSPLFVLPITAALGERVTWRAVIGATVGVLGIALLLGVVKG